MGAERSITLSEIRQQPAEIHRRPVTDAGEIVLHVEVRWMPADAWQFLSDVPKLESAGIVVRAPGNFPAGRPARPLIRASVGAQSPSLLGLDALLDFSVEVTLEGEQLSAAEIKALPKGGDGLQLMRGRWVQMDSKKLGRLLERFQLPSPRAVPREQGTYPRFHTRGVCLVARSGVSPIVCNRPNA
jgi:hypothetical protein